jgi:hypothetical protein
VYSWWGSDSVCDYDKRKLQVNNEKWIINLDTSQHALECSFNKIRVIYLS